MLTIRKGIDMKVLKLLFSRVFIVVFAMLLELVAIVLSMVYLSAASTLIRAIGVILAFFVFLSISVRRKQLPEMEIPWFVTIMAFPIFGVLLYIMIAKNVPTKKQTSYLKKSDEEYTKNVKQTTSKRELLEGELGRFYGIESYLSNTSHTNGFLHSDACFFSSGELFYKDLIQNLKKAKSFIFMEFFIVGKGKMWDSIHSILLEKVREGVEVKFLYDDMGTAGRMLRNLYKTLISEGIDCKRFNPPHPHTFWFSQ